NGGECSGSGLSARRGLCAADCDGGVDCCGAGDCCAVAGCWGAAGAAALSARGPPTRTRQQGGRGRGTFAPLGEGAVVMPASRSRFQGQNSAPTDRERSARTARSAIRTRPGDGMALAVGCWTRMNLLVAVLMLGAPINEASQAQAAILQHDGSHD